MSVTINPILLRQFGEAVARHRLALYSGAGVSCDAKMPTWNALLGQLLAMIFNDLPDAVRRDTALKELESLPMENVSALVAGRLIESRIGQDLSKAVQKVLINCFDPAWNIDDPLPDESLLKPIVSGPLMTALSELIRKSSSPVITYNYDHLLEDRLRLDNCDCTSVLFPQRQVAKPGVLPIYHVHGWMPLTQQALARQQDEFNAAAAAALPTPANDIVERVWRGEPYNDIAETYCAEVDWVQQKFNEAMDSLAELPLSVPFGNFVLGEDAYHREYAEPFRWSNMLQTALLSRHVALFVGLSLNDPNHRRLIDLTNRAAPGIPRFAILSRESFTDKNKAQLPALSAELGRLRELALVKTGIRAIWVSHFSEVPDAVRQLAAAV